MSKQTYRVCFCFRRRFRLAAAEAPEEIKNLFDQYSENGIVTVDHLRRFLIEVQKEDKATTEDAQAILDGLSHLGIFHRKGLNLEGFFKYLFSDSNPPLWPHGVTMLSFSLSLSLSFSQCVFRFL
jgi:phosphatidylinositol phospholipase C delta